MEEFIMISANYMQSGRYWMCLHCQAILPNLPYTTRDVSDNLVGCHNAHYCGADWQEIPEGCADWVEQVKRRNK